MIIVSDERPGLSGRGVLPKRRDSHLAMTHPASAETKMIRSGVLRPAGVLIKASAATNTPISETIRWPDAVHLSDLERRVAARRASPDSTEVGRNREQHHDERGKILARYPAAREKEYRCSQSCNNDPVRERNQLFSPGGKVT